MYSTQLTNQIAPATFKIQTFGTITFYQNSCSNLTPLLFALERTALLTAHKVTTLKSFGTHYIISKYGAINFFQKI
jgi:hypothetical protein